MARTVRFQMIALFSVSDRVFGSQGTTTNLGSFWGISLGVAVRCCGKVIPTCGLSGGGLQSVGRVDTRAAKIDH